MFLSHNGSRYASIICSFFVKMKMIEIQIRYNRRCQGVHSTGNYPQTSGRRPKNPSSSNAEL